MKAPDCEHICSRNGSTNIESCSCNQGYQLDVNNANCSGMHHDGLNLCTCTSIESRPCCLKQILMNAVKCWASVNKSV